MNGIITKKFLIRLSALIVIFLVGSVLILFSPEKKYPDIVFLSFFCGLGALSLYPITYEVSKYALAQALTLEGIDVVLIALLVKADFLFPAILVFNSLFMLVVTFWTSVLRFRRIKALFRQNAVLVLTQELSRFAIRLGIFACAVLYACFGDVTAVKWLSPVLAVPFYFVVHYSCYSDRMILFTKEKETVMRDLIMGNLRSIPYVSDDEDARMSRLYARVNKYLETSKSFLREDFTVKELASAVYSNRSYLSKTINYFSGKNFNQFINYFRVMYAIELMKRDSRMKMYEISALSGFHSVVTFTMAFRMYAEDTPAAYREKLKIQEKMK